ncbi:CMRF35-like molecule 5 isoform X1 [Hoplias malabaricus]|uniref:CMRF35-like molecule 5 isoform X1 n=1 Tax=Hoplias malabaricus TaxID=27720 RepID=UPI0034623196
MTFTISTVLFLLLMPAVRGMLCQEIKVSATEGSKVDIPCPYTKGYETYPKYFCQKTPTACEILIKMHGVNQWIYKARISITEIKEKRKFVVTFKDLRMEDTGNYTCRIQKTGLEPSTPVYLTVKKVLDPLVISHTTVASTCTTQDIGDVTVSTVSSITPYSVTKFSNQPSTSGTALNSVLMLSVLIPLCALLLFAGVFLFFYNRWKKRTSTSVSVDHH